MASQRGGAAAAADVQRRAGQDQHRGGRGENPIRMAESPSFRAHLDNRGAAKSRKLVAGVHPKLATVRHS